MTRIKRLETQVQAILAELHKLKSESPSQTAAAAKPIETKPADTAEKQPKLGVDIGKGVRLIPYGTLFFNAYGNSGGTNNADVPLFATTAGSGNISASARQTRLGLRLKGARLGNARLGAVIEGDFFGGFPSVGIGENFGVVRLRLAYARLDWERTSVTVGQDWMVFAPVNPVSIAAAGNPQMGAGGNLWARLPQVRVDQKLNSNLTVQAAALESQTGDFATNAAFVVQPTSGQASRVPFLQSRLAYSSANWLGTKKTGSIGLSGHFGVARVFSGPANIRNDVESVGVALDWNFPVDERVTIAGEAFLGRNLGGFQGGVFLLTDNALAVGDRCRISDRTGVVEDITLRSVRLRTYDQTLLSIPAGILSQESIENYSTRQTILIRSQIRLDLSVSSEKLEAVLTDIRKVIQSDSRIDLENSSVHLSGFGSRGADIDLRAYVLTSDQDAFLEIREEVLLRIARTIEDSGARFAAPWPLHTER